MIEISMESLREKENKKKPYFLCPVFWSFKEGNLCLITRTDCENHIQKCPKLKEYIMKSFI